ncbi:MAG TPA: hypothetical protein VG406_25125 [Isosphaeraceae bacterium]|jgi:hypothetical protein|nr:hypothetical protein [Isosphaeraceae bacterium]
MRSRRNYRFRPVGLDALEDRTVMSSAASLSAMAATPVTTGQTPQQQQTLVDQVLGQVDQAFSNFATQYRQARDAYFTSLAPTTTTKALPDSTTSTAATDALTTYQQTTSQLVATLTQQVLAIVNSPGGGGGLLLPYLQARLGGTQGGGLANDLLSIPAVGTNGLNSGDFFQISEQAITNALNATTSSVQLYDAALFQVGNAFFSGQLAFGKLSSTVGTNPGGTQQQQQSVTDQVLGNVYQAFTNFVNQYDQVRANYLGVAGGGGTFNNAQGDVAAYNAATQQLTATLAQQVVAAVGAPTGGATLLTTFLRARIGSTQYGGLAQQLTAAPGANASPAGFSLATSAAISSALESTINSVRLYDASLVQGAFDLFVAAQARDFRRARAMTAAHSRSPGTGVAAAITGARMGNSVNTGVSAGIPTSPAGDPTVTTAQALGGNVTVPGFTGTGTITGTGLGGFINVPGFTGFGTTSGVPLLFNGFTFTPNFGFTATATNPFFGFGGMGPFVTTTALPSLTTPGLGLGFGNGFGVFNAPFNNTGFGFGGIFF